MFCLGIKVLIKNLTNLIVVDLIGLCSEILSTLSNCYSVLFICFCSRRNVVILQLLYMMTEKNSPDFVHNKQ